MIIPELRVGVVLSLVAAGLLAGSAHAAGGQIEISQSAAAAGGVTPSDAPGFPVTLDRAGSYVLTSNLVIQSEALSAIRVLADDVRIDLNGFALIGPRTCEGLGAAVSCTGTATGVGGIRGEASDFVSVSDGTIRGFWRGVWLGERCTVAEVISFANAAGGFFCGSGSLLGQSVASRNGGSGFVVGAQSVVREVVASGNALLGINASAGGPVVLERNVAGQNGQSGILCSSGCSISQNVSTRNTIHGVNAGSGSIVSSNVTFENDGNELLLGATSGSIGNVVSDVRAGASAPISGGVALDQNVCNGSTSPTSCSTAPGP